MGLSLKLFNRYNTGVPRYTSYPSVPHWKILPTQENWKNALRKHHVKDGVSMYIHLPFCESLCTYCACNTRITKNHSVEDKYIKALLKEASLYSKEFGRKINIQQLHLGGGTPTFFSAQNLLFLLESLKEYFDFDLKTGDYSFEAHPSNTSEEHLKILFDFGFRRLSFGIQDFDEKVQKAINRKQSFEEVNYVVNLAREIGYNSINFDLIYGLPHQNVKSISETLDAVKQMKPERIAFYSYAHVPWKKPGQRGYSEEDLPQGKEKYKLLKLGIEALTQMGYHEIGMDHFALEGDELLIAYKEGTLNRNFMGYTEHQYKLLISLGASSISASEEIYVQNEKVVEDYYERLEKDEFPIVSGHILTDTEIKIRACIIDLMCFQKTEIPLIEELQYFDTVSEKLMEFTENKMIKFENRNIIITKKGRPFLRNIATAFDPNIMTNNGVLQFSKAI